MITKACIFCKSKFQTRNSEVKRGWGRFCSLICAGKYRIGGLNPAWKGDNVGYNALHKWVGNKLGTPNACESCEKTGLTGHKIHWANKSKKYLRDVNDWLRLCAKCHMKYDKTNLR